MSKQTSLRVSDSQNKPLTSQLTIFCLEPRKLKHPSMADLIEQTGKNSEILIPRDHKGEGGLSNPTGLRLSGKG